MNQIVNFDLKPRYNEYVLSLEVRQTGEDGKWFCFRTRNENHWLTPQVYLHLDTILNALPFLQLAAERVKNETRFFE